MLLPSHFSFLLTGAASVEVSNAEQASAVDVEMKDANGDADPNEAGAPSRAEGEEKQASNASAPARDGPSGTGEKEALAGAAVKQETADKKERESTVDEDLVRAFRYFDKTGQCCWQSHDATLHACGLSICWSRPLPCVGKVMCL